MRGLQTSLSLALILFAAPAAAQAPTAPAPLTALSANADFSSRPHIAYPGGVTGLTDVTYAVIEGYRPIKMNLYLPPTPGPHPVVVFLHGGGWTEAPQNPDSLTGANAMAALAARGFVVATPGYRLSSEAKFPAQLRDAKTAIRWLRTYARTYKADPARVIVWGTSAGGNIASLVATTCGVAEFEAPAGVGEKVSANAPAVDADAGSCVMAAVDWYGSTDFSRIDAFAPAPLPIRYGSAESTGSRYIGCAVDQCPDKVRAANPMTYITPDDPPFLIMHGDADTQIPWQQSQFLHDALKAKGIASELILVPGANHQFAGIPRAQGEAQLETTFRWLEAHSKK